MTSVIPYCRRCWFPSTKPNVGLSEDGICQACDSALERQELAAAYWRKREEAFSSLIRDAIAVRAPNFDVVVPVSGGKDSITQVVRANQHGARILAICVDYGVRTEVGRKNLDVIPRIGEQVHLQVYRPPLRIHRQLVLHGLRAYGDPDLFSHTLLHAYPLHQALALQVPLVVLGENSAAQYGGNAALATLEGMTREWFEVYAVSGGNSVMPAAVSAGIDPKTIEYYDFPDRIQESITRTVFLSSFFRWDSEEHLRIAKEQGFTELAGPREGTFRTYVGIDEHINRIHQYLKFLKFGYGRTTDHVCEEIRLGRLTREQGRQLILEHEVRPPSAEAMLAVADFLQLTPFQLATEMEAHRDRTLWQSGTTAGVSTYALNGFVESAEPLIVESLTAAFEH